MQPDRRREITADAPILGTVLRLAWPVIAAEALHAAFHIVDTAWVGGLGTDATAALTTSMFVVWLVLSLASLVNTGITAHVSRAVGAGDRARAGAMVTQGAHLALLLGALVAIGGWIAAPLVFAGIGAPAAVRGAGTAYVRVLSLGSPATFLYLGAAAALRATGDTRTPLRVIAVSVVVNAGLAPLFIYGLGLGVPGAAGATVICQLGSVIAFARIARRGDLPFDRAAFGRIDWRAIRSLALVGAPYCVVVSMYSLVYLVFSALAARFGSAALAVVGVGNRLESICYLSADGFAAAAATMVGQNLGAGRPERAQRGAWTAVGTMSLGAAALTLLFLAIPRQLFSLFTRDAAVIAQGAHYLRILAFCQIATGVDEVVSGSFAGAGDTVPPLLVNLVVSGLRVPLVWYLAVSRGLGLDGIAWTITVTCVARACIMAAWFLRGRWKGRALAGQVAYARSS